MNRISKKMTSQSRWCSAQKYLLATILSHGLIRLRSAVPMLFRMCGSVQRLSLLAFACLLGCTSSTLEAEDLVEFLNGAKVKGSVTSIRKEAMEFDFTAPFGQRTVSKTYRFQEVHAVTYQGKRFILTPMNLASVPSPDTDSGNSARTPREVDRVIDQAGKNFPDWFASTELNYPPTLDLGWPIKPEGGWNNQKNMGQFIWDVINPNPGRWKSGIKLVHLCLDQHAGQAELMKRDRATLGRMYFDLLQDYERAAYWFRLAGVQKGEGAGVKLAECYWRLGCEEMALQQLVSRTYTVGAAASAIKLYGNMSRYDDAQKMMARVVNTNAAYEGLIAMGDAMRQAGRFEEAIDCYEGVLASKQFRNADYENRFKKRASESIEAIQLFEQVNITSLPDGTYEGESTGYNGKINVEVSLVGGQIESVEVVSHNEKQFYSAITDTQNSILRLQSVRGVDGTSGATITSQAIVNATAKSLAGTAK